MQVALLERLCTAARDDLSLGLLSPTQARQLVRLPAGNQVDALSVARRESLNGDELRGVIDLLLASGTSEKKAFVPEKPRLALEQAAGLVARSDPSSVIRERDPSEHTGHSTHDRLSASLLP